MQLACSRWAQESPPPMFLRMWKSECEHITSKETLTYLKWPTFRLKDAHPPGGYVINPVSPDTCEWLAIWQAGTSRRVAEQRRWEEHRGRVVMEILKEQTKGLRKTYLPICPCFSMSCNISPPTLIYIMVRRICISITLSFFQHNDKALMWASGEEHCQTAWSSLEVDPYFLQSLLSLLFSCETNATKVIGGESKFTRSRAVFFFPKASRAHVEEREKRKPRTKKDSNEQ